MAGADLNPASALRLEEVTRALGEIPILFGGSDREFPSHDLKGFGWAARRAPVACGLAQQCCNSDFQWRGLDRSNQSQPELPTSTFSARAWSCARPVDG